MKKDIILFKQAFELKQLGFDEECFAFHQAIVPESVHLVPCWEVIQSVLAETDCVAPTYSQAFRWFRDKHKLTSWVYNSDVDKFFYTILQNGRIVKAHESFKSHEEAETACLDKLLEIAKNA